MAQIEDAKTNGLSRDIPMVLAVRTALLEWNRSASSAYPAILVKRLRRYSLPPPSSPLFRLASPHPDHALRANARAHRRGASANETSGNIPKASNLSLPLYRYFNRQYFEPFALTSRYNPPPSKCLPVFVFWTANALSFPASIAISDASDFRQVLDLIPPRGSRYPQKYPHTPNSTGQA